MLLLQDALNRLLRRRRTANSLDVDWTRLSPGCDDHVEGSPFLLGHVGNLLFLLLRLVFAILDEVVGELYDFLHTLHPVQFDLAGGVEDLLTRLLVIADELLKRLNLSLLALLLQLLFCFEWLLFLEIG